MVPRDRHIWASTSVVHSVLLIVPVAGIVPVLSAACGVVFTANRAFYEYVPTKTRQRAQHPP